MENSIKTVNDILELAKKRAEEQLSDYFYRQRDDGKYVIVGLKQGTHTDLTVPSCVSEIAKNAFSGLHLTSVTFNEGLEKIGEFAFAFSSHINMLSFPSTLKKIGNNAFSGCRGLRSVILPQTLEEIDDYAFDHCSSLSTVFIPESVSKIGDHAFMGCTNLKKIYCGAQSRPAEWSERWFDPFNHVNVYWGHYAGKSEEEKELVPETICSDQEYFQYSELEDGSLIVTGFKTYLPITKDDGSTEWIKNNYDFDAVTTLVLPQKTVFV